MTQDTATNTSDNPFFVSRQPIFDRQGNIWGYELMVQLSGDEHQDASVILDSALSEEMSESMFVAQKSAGVECLFLRLPPELAKGLDRGSLKYQSVALALCNDPEEDGCDFFECMRDNDLLVARDVGQGGVGDADIICMSMAGKEPREVMSVKKSLQGVQGRLLATDVTTWEDYQGTKALGFDLFQGQFFTNPLKVKDKEISSNSMVKMKILAELNNPDVDMGGLAQTISSDPSLSLRLLKYINSAAFGLSTKIKSLRQAISLLGLKEVKRWAMMVLLSDMDSSSRGMELAYLCLQRARFLELMAEITPGMDKSRREEMFILGLFSNIDALFAMDMESILEDVPLDDAIKDALCGRENDLTSWITLFNCIEKGDWTRAREILSERKAPITTTATLYMKASSWAAKQLPNMSA